VDRFLQFAAIQENRAVEAALKFTQISQDQIDAKSGPGNTVAEVRERFELYKGNFKATTCPVCGVRTPPSWDLALVSMVQRVGEPYKNVFLLAYTNPNFHIHATLASANEHDESQEEKEAEVALLVATELFLALLRSQNILFSLKLDADIDACTKDLRDALAQDLSST
jgi:hypothetical protein